MGSATVSFVFGFGEQFLGVLQEFNGSGDWMPVAVPGLDKGGRGQRGTSYNPSVKHKVCVFNKRINSIR